MPHRSGPLAKGVRLIDQGKMMQGDRKIEILDTTLRDGAQTTGVAFSLQDKIEIATRLDRVGISFIEGGWPGSNPKDLEFFRRIKDYSFKNSKIAAFGATKKKGSAEDPSLRSIVDSDVRYAVLFGKSWLLHVEGVLRITADDNLTIISESIEYLRKHGMEVIYDAEHFFDGYMDNRDYAISTIRTAKEAGARTIVLADTNGGTLPQHTLKVVRDIKENVGGNLGIHAHNDSGVAVANSLLAASEGFNHIQGTVNGLGERCGNADIIQIIPSLELKMGVSAIWGNERSPSSLKELKALSSYVYDLLNITPDPYQPYVGRYAFSHKGGVHVDAMIKDSRAYEHVDPELIGNTRNYVVSELAGRAAVLKYAQELGLDVDKEDRLITDTLTQVKEFEKGGLSVESADATVKLILLKNRGVYRDSFNMLYWMASARNVNSTVESEGEVIVRVDNEVLYEREKGVGPVHALDNALRKGVLRKFPLLKDVQLLNYKVGVFDGDRGTASSVRVLIEFGDGKDRWATAAVSDNILEASARALSDGYNYKLGVEALSSSHRR